MRRLAIFAHFDDRHEIKRYVTFFLERLRAVSSRVVVVSTSALSIDQQERLRRSCDEVLLRENVGFDFAMWRSALEREDLGAYDELVLTNSSVLGPIHPFPSVFEKMASSDCDYWGMTESEEIAWCLQSYFLVFRKRLLHHEDFMQFWSSILPYRNKRQTIRSYEIGLSQFFADRGFRGAPLVPLSALPSWSWTGLRSVRKGNPTTLFPVELMKQGMPFLKIEVLRDNPGHVFRPGVLRALRNFGFDESMVEFERRRYFNTDARRD